MKIIEEASQEPLISVIVPIYNVEKYVEKCVQSILNQTYKNLEIILVDDGSTDESPQIIDRIAKKDVRVKCVHKTNGGLSDARNKGVEMASGEYLGFVDGDDWIHPQMYEILYKSLKETDTDMSCCDWMTCDEDVFITPKDMATIENKIYDRNFAMEYVGDLKAAACNKLYKRELFNEVRYPYGKIHEDEFVIHKLIFLCEKISLVDSALYYYVQREGSIMRTESMKGINDAIEAWEDRLTFIDENWCTMYGRVVNSYCEYLLDRYFYYKKEKNADIKKLYYTKIKALIQNNKEEISHKYKLFIFSPMMFKAKKTFDEKIKLLINDIYSFYLRIKVNCTMDIGK